jgi:hypothetical protein
MKMSKGSNSVALPRIDLEMIDPFQIFLDDIDRVGEWSR